MHFEIAIIFYCISFRDIFALALGMNSYQSPSPSSCKSYRNAVYGILVSLIAFILTLIALYYSVRRINICLSSSVVAMTVLFSADRLVGWWEILDRNLG